MSFVQILVGFGSLLLFTSDFGLAKTTVNLSDPGNNFAYEVHTELKTWDEASDFCLNEGKTLAYTVTQDQHKNLRKYIQGHNLLPKTTTSGYWLDGRYNGTNWIWVSPGIDLRSDDVFMAGWHWDEPNRKERNGERQNCVELKYIKKDKFTEALSWNNMWCDEKRGFVCQYISENLVKE